MSSYNAFSLYNFQFYHYFVKLSLFRSISVQYLSDDLMIQRTIIISLPNEHFSLISLIFLQNTISNFQSPVYSSNSKRFLQSIATSNHKHLYTRIFIYFLYIIYFLFYSTLIKLSIYFYISNHIFILHKQISIRGRNMEKNNFILVEVRSNQ